MALSHTDQPNDSHETGAGPAPGLEGSAETGLELPRDDAETALTIAQQAAKLSVIDVDNNRDDCLVLAGIFTGTDEWSPVMEPDEIAWLAARWRFYDICKPEGSQDWAKIAALAGVSTRTCRRWRLREDMRTAVKRLDSIHVSLMSTGATKQLEAAMMAGQRDAVEHVLRTTGVANVGGNGPVIQVNTQVNAGAVVAQSQGTPSGVSSLDMIDSAVIQDVDFDASDAVQSTGGEG